MKVPDQPKRLSFQTKFEADRLDVKIRSGSLAIGGFMLVWLSGWSVGCGLLIYRAREQWLERGSVDPEIILFAVPFWVSWLFVVAFASNTIFGRELFTLDDQGASYRRRILLFTWARVRMPLEELIRFGTVDDELHSATGQSGVVVNLQSVGRPIRFGSMLAKPERDWLTHTLNQKLYAWQRTSNHKLTLPVDAPMITFARPLAGELLSGAVKDDRTIRTASDMPVDLPSDSRWKLRDDYTSTRYALRGRLTLGAIGGLLFINLFVNGILGIFVKILFWPGPGEALYGIEWLFRFLFLIPFELIGLALILTLLLIAIEPLRVWSWRFYADRIVWKLTWFGLGFRKTYRFDRLERLEVRRVKPSEVRGTKSLRLATLWAPQGYSTYSIVCIDAAGRTAAEIEGLTFGEACWMADSLVRAHPEWFG